MVGPPEEMSKPPTGRHGLPPNLIAEYQRERLLAATIELVAKRGYHVTSIDHIVKTAKVGYVAFYDLFDGKEDCFLAAFDEVVAAMAKRIGRAARKGDTWPEQISLGLEALVEMVAEDPARARIALVEVQAAGPRSFARFERLADWAAPKLREGREFNPDAAAFSETLEETILGGIIWIIHQRLVKGEGEQVRDLAPLLIQVALSPYLGEAEATRLGAGAAPG